MSIRLKMPLAGLVLLSLLTTCHHGLSDVPRPCQKDDDCRQGGQVCGKSGLCVTADGGGDGSTDTHRPDLLREGGGPDLVSDLVLPDRLVTKDVLLPDQSQDLGAVLASGTFSTGGPGSGGNMLLVEGGFEVGGRLCASTKDICIVGGIVP